jgi:hypothetical protein
MDFKKYFTTITPLSKSLAMVMMVLLPFGGFYLGTKYNETETMLADSSEPIQNVGITGVNLVTVDNEININDNGRVLPLVKLAETNRNGNEYRLYLVSKTIIEEDIGPDCNEAVYFQKNNERLKKIYEGGGCEFIWAEPDFLENPLDLFQINHTGDGGFIVLYNLEGQKVSFSDEKKILEGWAIYKTELVGRNGDPATMRVKLFMYKDLGAKNATVLVDVDNFKVLPETLTNLEPGQ